MCHDKHTWCLISSLSNRVSSVLLLVLMGGMTSIRALEPSPADLVHVATKIDANLQKLKSLRGRYRLDYRTSPGSHYDKWEGQPVEVVLHDVLVEFAIEIAEKPTLKATFDPLTDDVLRLKSGKQVTVPNSKLGIIAVLQDGEYRHCHVYEPRNPLDIPGPGNWRVVQIDNRELGTRDLYVTNPIDFYAGRGTCPDWLRSIARNDSERKKFTMVKEGPLWTLSFTAKTPHGDDIVLSYTFDARVGFNEVEMHETIHGRTRYKQAVRFDIQDGVYVPVEVSIESYTFNIEFQSSRHYTLESIEINPKLTDEDFGFAPFKLINGDTVFDTRTRKRTWHWDGEFISKEEFERRWKASQKGSSAQVSRPGSRVAMIACTCMLAIAASTLLRRRKATDSS